MVHVDVVILDARTEVESADSDVPLLFEVLVLGAGVFVAERSVDRGCDARESVARARVVTSWDGKIGHIGIVWQSLHPVFSLQRQEKE